MGVCCLTQLQEPAEPMTGGDIAGLIAAGVFAVLVALLAVPIIKLGRVFDELRVWIRDLNAETEPLIDEVVRTVATTNSQLEKVDGITDNVSDASANVSAMTSLVASTVGQPIIKVAAFSSGVRRAFSPEASRARRAQERQMRAAEAPQADDGATTAQPDAQAFQATSFAASRNDDDAAPAPSSSSQRPWWEGTEFDTPAQPSTTAGDSVSAGDADEEPVPGSDPVVIEMQTESGSAHGQSTASGRHAASPAGHTESVRSESPQSLRREGTDSQEGQL